MEELIKSLEGAKGGKSKNKETPQEVVSNMQFLYFFFLDNKLVLQIIFMCLHVMLQNGVLAVHVKTLKIIDSESKWAHLMSQLARFHFPLH